MALTLGERLRRDLHQSGLRVSQLAERAGTSRQNLYRILSGGAATVATWERIQAAFKRARPRPATRRTS